MGLTQQQHKLNFPSHNSWKYVFCNDTFHSCYCRFWLNNSINLIYQWKSPEIRPSVVEDYICVVVECSTNSISNCISLENTSFVMVNYICVVVDSDSTTAQCRFLIAYHLILCHLRWNISVVLLLTLTQQQHKLDITSQNTWKCVFYNDKFHLLYCWLWLNNNIYWIIYWKWAKIHNLYWNISYVL